MPLELRSAVQPERRRWGVPRGKADRARCAAGVPPLSARLNPQSLRPSGADAPMAQQYIFQMQGLTKAFPGAPKKTFSDIWLSFYPDAEIGVVGVNGSGKSTRLKITAGLDKEFQGEAFAAEGVKRG